MNPIEVKTRAKAIFRKTYHYPEIPFRSIGRRCFAWAMERARFELKHGTDAERFEREANQIAEACGFDVERLTFQVVRRAHGSFTTTVDGSPERRRVYERALAIAQAKRRSRPSLFSLRIRGVDNTGAEAFECSLGRFFADNRDGIERDERVAIAASLTTGKPYRVAGFVGGYFDLFPLPRGSAA